MKKLFNFWGLMGLAFALSLGSTLRAAAQDDDKPAGEKGHPAGSWEEKGGWERGPLGMMKKKLDLTDDQASKMKELFKKQREENEPLREQTKIDMDTLRLKVDSKASDSEIKKVLEALSADQKKMEEDRGKMKEELSAILTPTQKAKMLLDMEWGGGERMRGMRMRRMGGREGDHSENGKPPAQDM